MPVDVNKVFDALPHVNEIWLTKDGHFHLHDQNGGEKITRKSVEKQAEAKSEASESEDATALNTSKKDGNKLKR